MPIAWLLGQLLDGRQEDLLRGLVGSANVDRLQLIQDDLEAAHFADALIRRSHWTLGIALDYHRLMPEA